MQTVIALAIAVVAMIPVAAGAQRVEFAAGAPDPCFFRSTMYGDGATSCQDGLQFRCTGGSWLALGLACSGEVIASARSCWLDGGEYATGEPSCHEGMQLRCDDGVWRASGAPCGAVSAPIDRSAVSAPIDRSATPPFQVSSSGESCRYEAITVSTGSTVCQMGTTYLCNDGQWVNMGTMCR